MNLLLLYHGAVASAVDFANAFSDHMVLQSAPKAAHVYGWSSSPSVKVELVGAAGVFEHASLPATLRGLVAARLDALPSGERAVLEDAAVVGKRGPIAALVATVFTIHSMTRHHEVVAAKAGDMRKRLAKRPLAVKGLGASEVAVHVLATAAHKKFKTAFM